MARCAAPPERRCSPTEQRKERDGTLRVLFAARIRDCRPCRLREKCQWHGTATTKPRRVSLLLHPLLVASAPVLWRDWSRRTQRRACLHLVRGQRVEVQVAPGRAPTPATSPATPVPCRAGALAAVLGKRLARNARTPTAGPVTITLFGVPDAFARFLGLATA